MTKTIWRFHREVPHLTMGDDGITRLLILDTDYCYKCRRRPVEGIHPTTIQYTCLECTPNAIVPDSLIDDDTITEAQRELANREIPADEGT